MLGVLSGGVSSSCRSQHSLQGKPFWKRAQSNNKWATAITWVQDSASDLQVTNCRAVCTVWVRLISVDVSQRCQHPVTSAPLCFRQEGSGHTLWSLPLSVSLRSCRPRTFSQPAGREGCLDATNLRMAWLLLPFLSFRETMASLMMSTYGG